MTDPFRALIPDGGLVVSCQARAGTALRDSATMARMAVGAADGGAVAIRANGPEDVAAIAARVGLPVIGINKTGDPSGVYITPTVAAAIEVVRAGARVVALDGTTRLRPDGTTLADQIAAVHAQAQVAVMADVDTLEAGLRAREAGADAVATTLAGYTGGARPDGPDVELVAALAAELDCPVVAEGRIRTDADVVAVRAAGAYAIVIGTAITNPAAITEGYVRTLRGAPTAVPRG